MKIAAIIEYADDEAGFKAKLQDHRAYLRTFLEDGRLFAAGPFADKSGALWVLDVDTLEQAEVIVKGDPLAAAGLIRSWKIRPFTHWSAKESKGK